MYKKITTNGKLSYDIGKYIIDTEEDLTKIPSPNFGSTAYVIHTGKTWVLDSEGYWHISTADQDAIACDCVSELTIWGDLQGPTAN